MSLTQFKNGGINITGFQLVNQTSKYVERFQQRWQKDIRTGSNSKSRIKVSNIFQSNSYTYRTLTTMMHFFKFEQRMSNSEYVE